MASDALDPIAPAGERLALGASSATNSFPPVGRTSSPLDVHDFLSLLTPVLRNSRNSLDVPTYPTPRLTGPSLYPPPSRTLSARSSSSNRWVTSTVLRNDNPEENDGLSSLGLLTPPSQGYRRNFSAGSVSSIGSTSTDRDSRPSSLGRSGISDVLNIHPSPTNTHVDAGSGGSYSSLAAGFFKRTVQRIRRPSPSPSAETDMGSETTDAGLNVEPFAFKPLQLASLVDPKSLKSLENLGGVEGLLRGLGTDRVRGLSKQPGLRDTRTVSVKMSSLKPNITTAALACGPEGPQSTASFAGGSRVGRPASPNSAGAYEGTVQDRQRIYGHNILPQRPTKSLLLLILLALQDKVIVLLSIAAAVSFALGLFQDFGTTRPQGDHPMDWVQGVAIIAAILIVAAVGSLNDWQRERQLQALNEKKEDRFIKVIRDGEEWQIDVHQVVVGDVVLLEPGEVIPCDGVFLSGHNVRCDESSAMGEPDVIKKLSYEECIALRDRRLMEFDPSGGGGSVSASQRKTDTSGLELPGNTDCFIVSGSKVVEGVGSYVVISVGTKSVKGQIMMALRRDLENMPLQLKLNDLSEIIAKIGSIAGGLLFAALLVRYFVQLGTNNPQRTPSEKGIAFVNILIIALTLVVAAVPEAGLPLAVTHALAFATKRMSKENVLVRALGSCETMANASVVCTNRTRTLTQNEVTVVAVSIGVPTKFARSLEENHAWTGSEARSDPNAKDFGVDLANLVDDSVRKFLQFQISTHFTAVIVMTIWALASSSEKPILGAVQLLWINIIMGTFATLALATDPVLDRNADKKADPLITVNMTKQILGQAAYQIIITLALHFLGPRILGFHHTDDPTLQKHHDEIVQTFAFNAFVFAQIFNLVNCRRLDEKLNVFEGMSKNRYFMAIITIEVAVQVLICFVGGAVFGVTRIGAREWCTSVGLGCVSLPLGALIRFVPNEPCERVFKKLKLLPERDLLPTTRPDAEPGYSFTVNQVHDNLGTFAKLRGGHMRGS